MLATTAVNLRKYTRIFSTIVPYVLELVQLDVSLVPYVFEFVQLDIS